MASTTITTPGPAFSLLHNNKLLRVSSSLVGTQLLPRTSRRSFSSRINHQILRHGSGSGGGFSVRIYASSDREASTNSTQQQQKPGSIPQPGVDTRIHWDNPDDGWLGVPTTNSQSPTGTEEDQDQEIGQQQQQQQQSFLGQEFPDLLNSVSNDSHYQFLGISAEADLEEIKAAYRRLSKEYHPDTTILPLRAASEKFMKLKEVYDVLSNEETRRFYDWTLAQEAASLQAEKMKMKLEDPYEQEVRNWESVPDMVDRLGGRNMKLSNQAMSALTIDAAILIFSICCIIYVVFIKEPY